MLRKLIEVMTMQDNLAVVEPTPSSFLSAIKKLGVNLDVIDLDSLNAGTRGCKNDKNIASFYLDSEWQYDMILR